MFERIGPRARSTARFLTVLAAIPVTLGMFAPSAGAGTILAASSVSANVATRSGFALQSIIDQNNLSSGYVSGVTDFDTYIASNPTDPNASSTIWATNNGVFSAQLTFDLGGPVTIESMAIWNRGPFGQGVRDFVLTAATDASFSTSVALGSFTAAQALSANNNFAVAEVFDFAPVAATYLRMDILNVHGSCCISISEVAFESAGPAVVDVSEPGISALLVIGLAGLGFARRRRTA